MTGPNVPRPAALEAGIPIRELNPIEKAALLPAARRYRGNDLIEIADALGLCGAPEGEGAYMATAPGDARLSPTFGGHR